MQNRKKLNKKITETQKRFLDKLSGGGDHDNNNYYGDEDNYDEGDYREL